MWLALIFAINFVIFGAHGIDSGFRISLEYLELTYTNDKYIELHVSTVQVSNKTKNIRGSGSSRYIIADNLEVQFKNKEHLLTRINKKRIKSFILFGMMLPKAEKFLTHLTPRLTWPPRPNVTYTLRDWWIPNSQVPNEIPLRIPTGRFRGTGSAFYPNDTVLASAEAIVNIIRSYEKFD